MIYLILYIISICVIGITILVINDNLKKDKYEYDAYGDAILVRKVLMVGMFIPFVNYILVFIILICWISKIFETYKERDDKWNY